MKRNPTKKKKISKSRFSIKTFLLDQSHLHPLVQPGLSAFLDRDKTLIEESERPRVADSLDLDAAMAPEFPDANRWDYLLAILASEIVIGIEPHSAKDSEVRVVIAKKKSAHAYLLDHFRPQERVSRWLWVSHGKVGFSQMDKAIRMLNQNGIEFQGRAVRKLA